jgi:O-methyltransferase domain
MTEDLNLDQMLDLGTPWCLMVAATLRIPDLIAEGHHDISGLATAAGCDRDALHAVLGHLVDLYLLKSVLNDWPDEETVAILRRCAEAAWTASSTGTIAVLGGVAPDDTPRSLGIDPNIPTRTSSPPA